MAMALWARDYHVVIVWIFTLVKDAVAKFVVVQRAPEMKLGEKKAQASPKAAEANDFHEDEEKETFDDEESCQGSSTYCSYNY